MHTDAFHHSLALIDELAVLVPRVHVRDRRLAAALRNAATAIPQYLATGTPERIARAHRAATRVHVMLVVAGAWGYLHDDDMVEALHTARIVHESTAP